MSATMQFEFRSSSTSRRREGGAIRLLVMGDFGARAHRGLADAASLARRPAMPVDVDSLDDAIARVGPRLEASLADGTAVRLAPTCIDDFHPDRLVAAHPPLASLLGLRRRLLDPALFAAAAAELGAATRADSNSAAAEDDRATIGRLLGGPPSKSAAGSNASAASTVAAFLRKTVPVDPRATTLEFQAQYLGAVDAPATAQLRALLHLPAYQSLEAVWRGVQLLVSRLDLGEEIELHLLDVTLDELRADTLQAAGDASRGALARRLRSLADEAADAEATWLLAGGLFSFGVGDLDVLAAIGTAARAAGMPFVAGADATITGRFPDASEWHRPDPDTIAQWQALRGRDAASAIGLVSSRLLLRIPYGRATDAIDSFPFEELAGPAPSAGELLWGEGALAAMLVVARADDSGAFDIDDLPALTYSDNGERALQPCAEWLIGERIGDQLTDHGLMPLLGSRHRNAVRLAGWRNIAL